jgi:hypothetical protein
MDFQTTDPTAPDYVAPHLVDTRACEGPGCIHQFAVIRGRRGRGFEKRFCCEACRTRARDWRLGHSRTHLRGALAHRQT